MRHTRLWLGALLLLVLGIGVAATTSVFTSSSANASNTFSSGTMSQSNSASGAILTAANMAPGDSKSGTVTITNTGTADGDFTLDARNLSDTDNPTTPTGQKLSSILDLKITQPTAPTSVYDGKFGAAEPLAAIPVGTIAAGASRTFTFVVTFPEGGTGDNAFQGMSTTMDFKWDATA